MSSLERKLMNYDIIESKLIRTISPEEKMFVGDERGA
jgi:hypothetical protein